MKVRCEYVGVGGMMAVGSDRAGTLSAPASARLALPSLGVTSNHAKPNFPTSSAPSLLSKPWTAPLQLSRSPWISSSCPCLSECTSSCEATVSSPGSCMCVPVPRLDLDNGNFSGRQGLTFVFGPRLTTTT